MRVLRVEVDDAVYDALVRWAADEVRDVPGQAAVLLRQAVVEAGRLRDRAVKAPPYR